MITKLFLHNWQAHSNLELDFTKDLNVITGYSNAGKSCIRRALEWVMFNVNISEKDYRKEGTKETVVTVYLDSGFIVERTRSNTINRYALKKEGCEDKVFDAIGKNIPDEIKDVLGVEEIEIDGDKLNLNIAEQLTLPFLLDKPASFRAKLFNKITGNELLDKLVKECNRESLRINRQIREKEELITKQENELSEYTLEHKELKKIYSSAKSQLKNIQEKTKIYESLKGLAEQVKENKEQQDFVSFKLEKISNISEEKINELKKKADLLQELNQIDMKLEQITCDIQETKVLQEKIPTYDVDAVTMKKKAEVIKLYKELFKALQENNKKRDEVTIQIRETEQLLGKLDTELEEIWEECKICPLCKKEK